MTETNLIGNVTIDFSNKNQQKTSRSRTNNGHRNINKPKIVLNTTSPSKERGNEEPVRIASLMGLEQVGQCMFMEFKDDIIIIDGGLEFCAQEVLGVDYIIPDISYIKQNIKKLKGVVLTHGHLDHIGALRDILPELGFPTIYTTPLTLGLVKKSFEDPKDVPKLKYKIVNPDTDIIKLGCFTIEFVHVNHNIPETMALAIHTPKGLVFNSADFKIDHTPAIDKPADLAKIARLGTEGVKLYVGDSLGASKPGVAVSEKVIGETLEGIIKEAKSRMIIATFASNVGRVIQIIRSAAKYNKVVFLAGRSMINNVEICQQLGYIDVPKGLIRKMSDEVNTIPDERVIVLCTGAQGEEFSALARMSRGEFPQLQLRKGDAILMSSSAIPGNELAMTRMINDLVVQDIKLITNHDMDIHTSGHGGAEDHKIMITLLKPEFFLPYYTDAKERYAHKKLALGMGMEDHRILMPAKNGAILEMYDDEVVISNKRLHLNTVLIDGKGKGHLSGEYVVKARKIMAEDGMLALVFKIDAKSKELVGNIQIESRGFVYSSEVKKIHTQTVDFARQKYYDNLKKYRDVKIILKNVKDQLSEYITKIIGRVPMILPMFVYINKDAKGDLIDDMPIDEALIGSTLDEQDYSGDATGEIQEVILSPKGKSNSEPKLVSAKDLNFKDATQEKINYSANQEKKLEKEEKVDDSTHGW